ncbi:MAG TPA: hypothetical protein VNP96_11200 [Solirubrobacterales bacterium]|nr:hypothetical protein [Solirubrobacterales bacterium]
MSIKRRVLRRLVPVAILATLAIAAPASGSGQGFEAAEWLGSQLKPTPTSESAHCESFSPAATVGQTIDCMLAFDAAVRSLEAKREATYAWIRENMDDYVGEESCEEEPASLSAGAVAKLALAVLSRGDDPRSVEGRDLIADLECMQVEPEQPQAGRFSDIGANDFSNVFGQSLALVSLKACEVDCGGAPAPEVEEALEEGAAYMRGQQCAESEPETLNGAFRSPLGLTAGECNEEPPFEPENLNAVDVDSTGAAVQGLYAEGSVASKGAGKEALNWLETAQQGGGFWESYCDFGMPTQLFPSVNSTASATMAYTQDEISTAAAQGWLAGVVEGGSGGLPACKASGSSDLLATAQGVLGLFGAAYPQLVGLP